MQRTKKIISALLAVVMLVSVFAVNVMAGAPAPSDSYIINIAYELCDTDGNPITKVTPGQTVILNVYSNSNTANDAMSNFLMSVYYDDEIYTYESVEWLGVKNWIDASNSKVNVLDESSTDNSIYTGSAKLWTADEKTAQPNWSSFLYITGTRLTSGTPYYVQENADSPMYSLQFKVSDTATVGASADFGCRSSVIYNNRKTFHNVKTAKTGSIGAGEIQPTETYRVTVVADAPAPAGPALTHAGRQVKMDVAGGAVVSGTEQLRVVSSISNDDWNNYFANTTDEAAMTKKLVEVGIVATQGAFNMEAAKAAAQQGKGTHGDYTVATTTYIQNTGSDYRFGARIEYQTNVFDTTYVAFAKYLNAEGVEAYMFYDASYALAFATDYDTISADYINFLNSQAA